MAAVLIPTTHSQPPTMSNGSADGIARGGSDAPVSSDQHGPRSFLSPLSEKLPEPSAEFLASLEGARSVDAGVLDIGNGKVVKRGRRVTRREALAMEYVRSSTTIPVPKVHDIFAHSETTYIVMDFVEGQTLEARVDSMSDNEISMVLSQLADYVRQLRALDPGKAMGAWPHGPHSNVLFNPPAPCVFATAEEFHAYWLRRVESEDDSEPYYARAREILREGGCNPGGSVLSHGDLNLNNIIVRGPEIVGIVDWECFGWYPDFWELMGIYRHSWYHQLWMKGLDVTFGNGGPMVSAYCAVLYQIYSRAL